MPEYINAQPNSNMGAMIITSVNNSRTVEVAIRTCVTVHAAVENAR